MALSKEDIKAIEQLCRRVVRETGKAPTFRNYGSRLNDADVERISRKNDRRLKAAGGLKRVGDIFTLANPDKAADAGKKEVPHPIGQAGVESVVIDSVTEGSPLSFTNTGTAKKVKLNLVVPGPDGTGIEEPPESGETTSYARDGGTPHGWTQITDEIAWVVENGTALYSIRTALAGGTAGQVLTKNSGTDYDFSWV